MSTATAPTKPAAQVREEHLKHAQENNLPSLPVKGFTIPVRSLMWVLGGTWDKDQKVWMVPAHNHAQAQAAANRFTAGTPEFAAAQAEAQAKRDAKKSAQPATPAPAAKPAEAPKSQPKRTTVRAAKPATGTAPAPAANAADMARIRIRALGEMVNDLAKEMHAKGFAAAGTDLAGIAGLIADAATKVEAPAPAAA